MLGFEIIKGMPNLEKIISLLKKWFLSVLENIAPYSGNSKLRG